MRSRRSLRSPIHKQASLAGRLISPADNWMVKAEYFNLCKDQLQSQRKFSFNLPLNPIRYVTFKRNSYGQQREHL